MANERCQTCGADTRAGTARFTGRRRLEDGSYMCAECARAGTDSPNRREVRVTMPNSNFPNTH